MKKKTIVATLAACAAIVPANAQQKQRLDIEMPKVETTGGPVVLRLKNLDLVAPEETFLLVPPGTALLSRNKPVTSSDKLPILGELSQITDGDKDAAEGYEVELAPGVQWVQIDLQKTAEIYGLAIWHFHRQRRACKGVIVQISDDAEFKTGVSTVFNADVDNLAKQGAGSNKAYIETNKGKLLSVNGVKGRYVRLYSAGNTASPGNHYVEVEVYGK
ncbi:MAG: discoidin domain-containing protein [Puniceicoccales bacterium]|jgi:hypothetical protein|nr:discoidin domain-containing protein [Puniceicoccales bacterium]